jgi:hypothetical protein
MAVVLLPPAHILENGQFLSNFGERYVNHISMLRVGPGFAG